MNALNFREVVLVVEGSKVLPGNSDIRILVLDDEPFMLKLLAHMLASLGFTQVTTCDNGPRALAGLGRLDARPELILLDLNMPEMDGVEFVRHLVDHQYQGSLILVSGETERMLQSVERLVHAHQIKLLGHAQKPVSLGILGELLAKCLPSTTAPPAVPKPGYSAEDLRAAIMQNELVNHYQPQVAIATGRVVGVEALVRWHHPTEGLVFPGQFIDLAETHGLMDDLTERVLTEALAQARTWLDSGLSLRVSVNVSMDNLHSPAFADSVADLAATAGIPPTALVLEVTESRLWQDLRVSLEILTRLRLKRFHLSIDDFGTGHSCLTQLHTIPFDELKIDHSFVHGAWNDKTLRAMYKASLGLANQLGMVVVAEGVEDQKDWDFLRRTGCELAQGYFISRPMHGNELPGWIDSWNEGYRDGHVPGRAVKRLS